MAASGAGPSGAAPSGVAIGAVSAPASAAAGAALSLPHPAKAATAMIANARKGLPGPRLSIDENLRAQDSAAAIVAGMPRITRTRSVAGDGELA